KQQAEMIQLLKELKERKM
ncbi:YrzO family protein, partial [Bacillus wiedmannii]